GLGDHVAVVPPCIAPYLLRRLEEVAHDGVVALLLAVGVARLADLLPVAAHPAMKLVEQLRLQYPFVLLAPPPEAVDAIAQRTVALAVEVLDHPRREAPVGVGPRDALVEIDEMALVDAGRGGIDDDEHFGREVLVAAVENHARP